MSHLGHAAELDGLLWHLTLMKWSAEEIVQFCPPADPFSMRMHYSNYLVNLVSCIDYSVEMYPEITVQDFSSELDICGLRGVHLLAYLRELRNAVVHRGLNITSRGTVIDEVVFALAPPVVENRNGNLIYQRPTQLLVALFRICEVCFKPMIHKWYQESLVAREQNQPQLVLDEILKSIQVDVDIPIFAKTMIKNNLTLELLEKCNAPLNNDHLFEPMFAVADMWHDPTTSRNSP